MTRPPILLQEDYADDWGVAPQVLPHHWARADQHPFLRAYTSMNGLLAILSAGFYDGQRWLHVSCSRRDRVPTYADLSEIKRVFIGRDRLALQLFVPDDEHVNIHPHALHLWSPLDHRPVPDFRCAGQI